jgi:hypothetical protein
MITKAQIRAFSATAHLAYSKQMAYVRSREKKGEDMSCVIENLFAAYAVLRHVYQYVQDFPMPEGLTNDNVVQSCYWLMGELKFQYDLQNGSELTTVNYLSINLAEL